MRMVSAERKIRLSLIAGLVFILLFAHIPVLYTALYHPLTGAQAAENGRMDGAGFTAGALVLDGEWEFYWDRLIVTEQSSGDPPDFLIRAPGYWSEYQIGGVHLPAQGVASYRLIVDGLSRSNPVTAYIPDFGSAYRVFVDGVLTAGSGTVSRNIEDVFTVPQAKLYPVTLSGAETHEIVIELATARFSGLYMAPVLADYHDTIQQSEIRESIRFILYGVVLFSFFAFIALFVLSRGKKLRVAYLPAIMLLILLRIMLSAEFYGFWQSSLFFGLSYEDSNPLLYLVTFILKFLLIFLIQEQFGVAFSKREKAFFFLYYAAIYLIYLFTPFDLYNRYLSLVLPVAAFALEVYGFIKVYRGRRRIKRYGLLIYWGVSLAVAGLIADCYYLGGNVYPNLSLALLVMLSACLLLVGLAYALRLADQYRDLAVADSEFRQARAQIAMQTEYYDALNGQMNEIRAIRHDTRHFIDVLGTLADEGRYDELRRFLGEYAERADTEPLPVFCQNTVANSILGYYALKARTKEIPFRCVSVIPKELPLSDGDLCVVLGNALENALEACAKPAVQSGRFIAVQAGTAGGQFLIKIENSYDGFVSIKDGELLSSKGGGAHGIGLQNIRRVVKSCGGFVKIDRTATTFTLMVACPHPVKAEAAPLHDSPGGAPHQ
ncbi:signal transduction histidine kinase regulating citrate/malate metabolism [Syntrophobotulus glycolicus DSM 8271]|uniref:Signal transduction histidine kinase regulating citrate/malate metabolism n=1 Tax=Syntrophobotulus glycolicus (strain DSM 8271 / FlGlyR) TaxID=645991 RepID=F0T1W2_SYNGF|nr:sensor histidine kinase [Syntrophobotulus glycolicus]ADY55226.1 signal transduction histidine kinase regulating citrate/malate metabolism [Syntrophobotulus glycolicus DSM 8271]